MVKVTFTLDDETISSLRRTSARLSKPQSQVVREAVLDYAARAGRLSETERVRMLDTFDKLVPAIPSGSVRKVDRELREIRAARRTGGRRHAREQ
jgi:hypothetical protein